MVSAQTAGLLPADRLNSHPLATQILLHPYVHTRQAPLLAFAAAHDIVSEAYSALMYVPNPFHASLPAPVSAHADYLLKNSPITHQPGGPVDKPVNEIAQRLNATADQVLLAWVKAKGAVVVTYGNTSQYCPHRSAFS
jgi:diketogulonate reductase-like aldo/keto reductase